ncbi:MAG: DUF29 domain-containing protein [Massilia sp.]
MNRPEPDAVLPSGDDAPLLPGYYDDFTLWLRAQAALLRERKVELLDVENLAEEVEGMARKEHRELSNRLHVVLVHLLKCQVQPSHRSRNWLGTLREQRRQIHKLIKDSPSLRRYVAEYADDVYRDAVSTAALETGLPDAGFPRSNPFSLDQLLDPDYVP